MLEELEEKEDVRVLGAVINGADVALTTAQQREDILDVEENGQYDPASEKVERIPVVTPVEF